MMGGAGNTGLLMSLGAGYVVLFLANKEKGGLRTLGFIIGVSIILLSSIFIVTHLCFSSRFLCMKCAMKMPQHMQQFSGEAQK